MTERRAPNLKCETAAGANDKPSGSDWPHIALIVAACVSYRFLVVRYYSEGHPEITASAKR